jgi:catechol 2,3-dioxygenase-like lactoylglutathione lyase family enzyme
VRAALYFVELAVTDWPAAVRWYQDVLGLEVLARDEAEQFALLAASGARLALKGGDAPASGALLAFEVEGLAEWVNRLREKGVKLEGRVKASPEGYRRVKFRGPGGVAVTLFEWGEAADRP